MHMKKRILVAIIVGAFVLTICGQAAADTAGQTQLSPRATADAFLHRSELFRIKYRDSNQPEQALQDLTAGKYDALEADLNKAEADFERDPTYELAFYDVLHAIADCDAVSLQRKAAIEAWVGARPKSAWSHLMLGRFYNFAGCQARGEGWAKDVTDEQWTKMLALHAQARPELLKAEQLEPKHLPIYTSLLGLSRTDNDPDGMTQAYQAGHKLFPTSFNLPLGYMMGLLPRWYGNYQVMDQFAASLKTQTQQNPLFWVFQGWAEADQGDLANRAGDLNMALRHYKNALQYGDQITWLTEAALLEWKLQDLGAALQYYHRDELYEMPLSKNIESQEEQLINYCYSNRGQCDADPRKVPWFGEPELLPGTP